MKRHLDDFEDKKKRMDYVYGNQLWKIIDQLSNISSEDPNMIQKIFNF